MTLLLLIASVVVTAAVVLVLVGYLLGIIYALFRAQLSLARLAGHLTRTRDNTDPLPQHLDTINDGLSQLLAGLLQVNGNLGGIVAVAKAAIAKRPPKWRSRGA